jgi:hypothetical protein
MHGPKLLLLLVLGVGGLILLLLLMDGVGPCRPSGYSINLLR